MIRLQPISTSDLQHYKFMEELLIDSFPPEEYRQLEQLREYTDRTGNFHNNIIFDDDLPVGDVYKRQRLMREKMINGNRRFRMIPFIWQKISCYIPIFLHLHS